MTSVPIEEYKLNCVTYGLDCAPFQALRGLRQCAIDHSPNERIRDIIFEGFYVDDLLSGADTIEQCQQDIKNISSTLDAGHLPLTKWMANDEEILRNVPADKRLDSYIDLDSNDPTVKTLGIRFHINDDAFSYKIKKNPTPVFTKRGMLSITAGLYDPVG